MNALVIHGPNLNLLGRRELAVYGPHTLDEVNARIEAVARELGVDVEITQSAREGAIIEALHGGIDRVAGAVLNPGAYAHTSRAIADAIRGVGYPVVEVHLSNIHAREPWRRTSVTAEATRGLIVGFGANSYALGLRALKAIVEST
jgi:3-dehydroquinate dehydratase-2